MSARTFLSAVAGALVLSACSGGSRGSVEERVVEEVAGGVNPYLWRASLDTLEFLPLDSADVFGGLIVYDWRSFPEIPGERVKATVYILDTRLRADGLNVVLFRQTQTAAGQWMDANIDPETEIQLENAILLRARNLKAAELS